MKITLGRLGGAVCALLLVTAMLGQDQVRAEGHLTLPNPELYFGVYGGQHIVLGNWDLSYFPDEGVSPNSSVIFGLRVGVQVTHWFAVEGHTGFIPFVLDDGGGGMVMNWSLDTLWSPFDYRFSPYVLVGLGMYHSAYGNLGDDADWEFHYGVGMRAMLDSWLAFRLEARHAVTDSYSSGLASNVFWTLGVDIFPWAYEEGEKDLDGDGLIGVDDDCPTIWGPARTRGCPDQDGDGIRDSDDRCPTLPGPPQNQGCPDTDGDGIFDDVDACPTVPGVAEYKGCPPPVLDSDGDGVPDHLDECPTVKGLPELKGCPPTQEFADLKVEDILFQTGSARLAGRSFAVLDQVVRLLGQYPTVVLEVHGHTDSQGPAGYNLNLSRERAQSVVDYLTSKGIAADRLSSQGFGLERPVDSNNTAAGRAKNRRTEFHISVR